MSLFEKQSRFVKIVALQLGLLLLAQINFDPNMDK